MDQPATLSRSTVRSLHSLCVENLGFAVLPLFWTRNHLSILKCEFRQIDDTAANPPPPRFERWIAGATRQLAYGLDPHGQIDSIFLDWDTPLRVAE
ncbi:Ff.00g065180.m01.CDS01 [Fusarium sp. VM40]|nr:Ff.00g065180.m01.CDS01 [Fusarium sp. VM40]